MNFLNSTQCEKMIIGCLDYYSLWTPEETADCVSYEHTEINDRDSDAPVVHFFEFTTTQKLSEIEFQEFYDAMREAFGVRGGYEETSGKACANVYLTEAQSAPPYMDDAVSVYYIRISFYYDI